jgi:hypothetical protein
MRVQRYHDCTSRHSPIESTMMTTTSQLGLHLIQDRSREFMRGCVAAHISGSYLSVGRRVSFEAVMTRKRLVTYPSAITSYTALEMRLA